MSETLLEIEIPVEKYIEISKMLEDMDTPEANEIIKILANSMTYYSFKLYLSERYKIKGPDKKCSWEKVNPPKVNAQ